MSSDVSMNSILADASVSTVCNPKDTHMLGSVTGSSQLSHAAATWLTPEGEALFVYVSHTGSIVVIKMPPHSIQGDNKNKVDDNDEYNKIIIKNTGVYYTLIAFEVHTRHPG